MLEKVDLSKEIKKSDYKELIEPLSLKVGELQREIRQLGIPVIIVFQGWDAAGKGSLINLLLLALDPRGFSVHPIIRETEEEALRPYMWRFWTKLPARGRIAIFDRSWYGKVLEGRVLKRYKRAEWTRAYEEITSFERQLTDDGTVILKFFLHISAKEQQKRFELMENNKATSWKVTKLEWRNHNLYDQYVPAIDEMLAQTDTDFAPWTILEAHDWRFATIKLFSRISDALANKIAEVKQQRESSEGLKKAGKPKGKPIHGKDARLTSSIIDKLDLSLTMDHKNYKKKIEKLQDRLRTLEHEVYKKRLPVIIVYEGCDAAGKGGNIRRLVQGLDPRGYNVIPIAGPNDVERQQHYLWRFWREFPKAGHIAIFDRSWYGRVMVERIEGFCHEDEWRRAFREINEMEEHIVNFGTVINKFWLQIDQEEQLRRFQERQNTPFKQWKITDEDWRNRGKWDDYKLAVDEMLFRTSTSYAPWTIVESNCKMFARIKVLETVINSIEGKL